jgi:hypothetical protein
MSEFEFAEDFLPVYDVSDAVAATVDTDREAAWRALLDVDLLKLGRERPWSGCSVLSGCCPRSSVTPPRRAPCEAAGVDAAA